MMRLALHRGILNDTEGEPRRNTLLGRLGSLRLTLWLFVLFLLAILLYKATDEPSEWLIAAPLLLFALNLLAAIVVHPAFRRQLPLLIFHLALLALLLLIAVGRLSHLNAEAEVTSGSSFSGDLKAVQAGPWHHFAIRGLRFTLEGFSVDYSPGRQRNTTRSTVQWLDDQGTPQRGVVGDHRPLVLDGYRFYTTHNKGFAPFFEWRPDGGRVRSGSIHLPSYPIHEYRQALEWTIPGSDHTIWSMLEIDEPVVPETQSARFHIPEAHRLVLRHDGVRHELRPGESLRLNDGTLTYRELRSWMGFKVFYDWTLPWLLACGVVAVLALGGHYWQKCAARPWREDDAEQHAGED